MPRDQRAYLADILDACDAITTAVKGIELAAYQENRLVRSSVEREFTIIGEALKSLSGKSPDIFASITHARRIVDFRNQLTHEYPTVDDGIVWAIATRDVSVLRDECRKLLSDLEASMGSAPKP